MTETTGPRYVTVGNTTGGPLVIDEAGHVLGAGELGTVNPDRSPARRLLEGGQLIEVEHRDDDDVSDVARRVFEETDKRNGGKTRAEVDEDRRRADNPGVDADNPPTTKPRARAGRSS